MKALTSSHVRIGALVLLIVTGILQVGNITQVFPFLPTNYAVLVTLLIVAVKEWLLQKVTPTTNASTPDNLPPAPPAAK